MIPDIVSELKEQRGDLAREYAALLARDELDAESKTRLVALAGMLGRDGDDLQGDADLVQQIEGQRPVAEQDDGTLAKAHGTLMAEAAAFEGEVTSTIAKLNDKLQRLRADRDRAAGRRQAANTARHQIENLRQRLAAALGVNGTVLGGRDLAAIKAAKAAEAEEGAARQEAARRQAENAARDEMNARLAASSPPPTFVSGGWRP